MAKKTILTAGLLVASLTQAQVQKIDLKKDLPAQGVADLYNASSSPKKKTLSPLSQLKSFELNLNWTECSKLAPSVFTANKDVQGWVALSWAHCLDEKQKKTKDPVAVQKLTQTLEQHSSLLQEGAWSSELAEYWVRLKLDYLESLLQTNRPAVEKGIDSLLSAKVSLSKEQQSKAYQLLGDIALLQNNYREAQFFFEEAQNQRDSKYIQDKLDFLLKTQGVVIAAKALPVATNEATGDEVKLEERVREFQKKNDQIAALKESVKILNEYPGSRSARRLKDRPLEIYNSLSEKMAKIKALDEMQEADSARIQEWASNLHRRADYEGALALSLRVVDRSSTSAQTTSALWIASRSAHFLGRYDQALKLYNQLMERHAGSDESAEAAFRSALIYFRKADYSTSAAVLEKLLAQNRDRYDLNARYWLVRSLEQVNPDRAATERSTILDKYPFSYYGLRLRAEMQKGKLTWPEVEAKAPELKSDFYVVGSQKKSWKRFKTLSDAGWVREAQDELKDLPFIKDPTVKLSLAQRLVERHQYVTAIRLLNDALDEDVRLRRAEFVSLGLPEAFAALYKVEAERYGLDAVLLKSLTRQESAFNFRAVSTSNALGLMQMIPPTAQEVAGKLGMRVQLPDDMFRPEVNIPMGSFYVSQMLDQFQGHVPLALAGYNAGPTRMKIWIDNRDEIRDHMATQNGSARDELWFDELPWTETSFYVKAILRNVLLYRLSEQGSYQIQGAVWSDLLNKKAK